MALSFPCTNCGKPFSVEAEPGKKVKCPHCRSKIKVPQTLESMPAPQIAQAGAAAAPQQPAQQEQQDQSVGGELVMSALNNAVPWVISLLLHLGLALIMVFVTMYVITSPVIEEVIVPDAALSENPGGRLTTPDQAVTDARTAQQAVERRHKADTSRSKQDKPSVIAFGGGAQGGREFWKDSMPGMSGPRSSFLRSGGNAYHIVYVIDCSGSMVDTFDIVVQEMLLSIGKLQESQDFHVILFAAEKPVENPPGALVLATTQQKINVSKFLDQVVAQGQTDPVPALTRAFDVLSAADQRRKGKLIYLLTDADFPDNAKVLAVIRERNKDRSVLINTFLYGKRPPAAEDVMKRIAADNGGVYRYVSVQ